LPEYVRFPSIAPLVFKEIFLNVRFISKSPARLALLAVLVLPAAASVQAAPYPQLDPQATTQAAHPETPVPAALYRSVFADLPTGVEKTSIDWKKANADVGQFKRGHADLLKWEQEQAKAQTQSSSGPSSPPTR
jgi:hypothetical protein